jgi:hypothetical protein
MEIEGEQDEASGRPEGQYANYLEVGHNAFEFVMDFGQFFPSTGIPQFHTRIITSPPHARAMLVTLQEALDRYQQAFGPIPEGES